METTLPKTGYCKGALCNKAAESSKNTKNPKVIDVISRNYTISVSPIKKASKKKLPTGDGEGKGGQSQGESAVGQRNGKKSHLIVVAQKEKRIVSNHKTIDTSVAGQGQMKSPTVVKQIYLNVPITKLLYSLSQFLCHRCYRVPCLLPYEPVQWLQAVDNALVRWGWQDHCFISLPSLVFLYMMCRSVMSDEIDSAYKLRQELLICLYLTYSYMGSEVTYPIRPFLLQEEREEFWDRCLEIIQCTSADMLKLNTDSQYFTQFFEDLLSQNQ